MVKIVTDLINELKSRYGGSLPFKRICEDNKIVVVKADLQEGTEGFCARNGSFTVIVLNQNLNYWERRDRGWHELYHAFKSPATNGHDRREEARANLFAALVRAPIVRSEETVDSLMEKYNVTAGLARIRLEYELRMHKG